MLLHDTPDNIYPNVRHELTLRETPGNEKQRQRLLSERSEKVDQESWKFKQRLQLRRIEDEEENIEVFLCL